MNEDEFSKRDENLLTSCCWLSSCRWRSAIIYRIWRLL